MNAIQIPGRAQQHMREVLAELRSQSQRIQKGFLKERVRIFIKHPNAEEREKILKKLDGLRAAKRRREFDEYITDYTGYKFDHVDHS